MKIAALRLRFPLFLILVIGFPLFISEIPSLFGDSGKMKELKATVDRWARDHHARLEFGESEMTLEFPMNQLLDGKENKEKRIEWSKMIIPPCSSNRLRSYYFNLDVGKLSSSTLFLNCVTASPDFDRIVPTIGLFPRARDYLKTVFKRLLMYETLPDRVVIIFDSSIAYLMNARSDLNNLIRSELGKGVLMTWTNLEELSSRKRPSHGFFSARDWIIVWMPLRQHKEQLESVNGFQTALKIVPYGPPEYNLRWPRSVRVLFWHPSVSYEEERKNCHFAAKFKTDTGFSASFHAAYLQATLDVARQVLMSSWRPLGSVPISPQYDSLLGNSRLDREGRMLNYAPIFIYRDSTMKLRWDMGSKERSKCES